MSKFGFVGPSYSAKSSAIADEECINLYAETIDTPGAQTQRSYIGTPGLAVFSTLPDGPLRGSCWTGTRLFVAAGDSLYEVMQDGTYTVIGDGALDNFGGPVAIVASNIQLLVIAGGRAYCWPLSVSTWTPNTLYVVGGSILDAAGHVQQATAAAWAPNTAYSLGAQIVDSNSNIQIVIVAGTSGAAAPTWNTAGSTPDGTGLIWSFQAASNDNAGRSGATLPAFSDSGGSVSDDGGTLVWLDKGLRLLDVTAQLAGSPVQAAYSDGYFVVSFADSNKFQMSGILDGTTWPGIQVNAVSVFPENITSIIVSHRELWVFGSQHAQPYYDSGSPEIFDVIQGALIEMGCGPAFGRDIVDNTVFWIGQDIRGGRQAWRASGYTPQRISTHAVETALSSYSADAISNLVSYSYQDAGHLFWVLYIPGTDCSWVYDVAESLWHKRAEWLTQTGTYGPHRSWNHACAFGKHLVGDWQTGNLWEMKLAYDTAGGVYAFVTDNGETIRRLRRSPTLANEMSWIAHAELNVDFATGLGPQAPLQDGDGNPRPPQAMLRWSDDRGATWSNVHAVSMGFAGEYQTRVIWRRLGRSRYRVYELTVSDPIPVAIVDAYLEAS